MKKTLLESFRCISCYTTGLIRHDLCMSLDEIPCPNCKCKDLFFDLNQSICIPSY